VWTFCDLLKPRPDGELFRAPPYGYAPMVRAAAESAGRAAWLLEPGIAYERRVARGIAELLYSMGERAKIDPTTVAIFETFRAEVEAECSTRGLAFKCKGNEVTVGELRPGNARVVKHLFRTMPPEFAPRFYSYYSATAHAVVWALVEHVDFDSPVPSAFGADLHNIYASTRALFTGLAAAAECYRRAFEDRLAIMGWPASRWGEITDCLEKTVKSMKFDEPSPEDELAP
jgi:hypothetical protein